MKKYFLQAILFTGLFFFQTNLHAWHDETHLAIAKAAGYDKWYNSSGADITKTKAGMKEQLNHYYNNEKWSKITKKEVIRQIELYDSPKDEPGHLYGAIIASIRAYLKSSEAKKYAEYHLAFLSHYIGDLSQPLHNTVYDKFNQKHHIQNDGTIEKEALGNIEKIKKNMYDIKLDEKSFEDDLAKHIARIANISLKLGKKMMKENRDMTKEEAYVQTGHSASLLKAVLFHLGKI